MLNKTSLYGPWAGWRMAGRELIAPDNTRFTPERLKGLAWQIDASNRRNVAAAQNAKKKPTQFRGLGWMSCQRGSLATLGNGLIAPP